MRTTCAPVSSTVRLHKQMLNKSNIAKAAILSVIVALVSIAIQIFSATRIHSYNEDIDWEAVNAMSHSDALKYLEENSHTISGVEAIFEHITEPILWSGSAVNLLLSALGFFISFIVLLAWVGHKKQPNKSLKAGTPQSGAP